MGKYKEILGIGKLELSNNCYTKDGNKWDSATLVRYCKEQKYKAFDMPLACVNMSMCPFTITTFKDFVYQSKRVMDTDLKYPIILDDCGVICDGWHRVCKAILEGRTHIKAIRILIMPNISGTEEQDDK